MSDEGIEILDPDHGRELASELSKRLDELRTTSFDLLEHLLINKQLTKFESFECRTRVLCQHSEIPATLQA